MCALLYMIVYQFVQFALLYMRDLYLIYHIIV